MFGPIGIGEILLVLVIALVIFGPKKLPEMGRALGKGIREFKEATRNAEPAGREETPDRPEANGS